ncbi:hypothetical protein [Fischerella thermalis]|uniref:hypothetical protein n=1 Tax=Fischerella thermalis TaxID=372787 RepID=UPI0010396E3E|nr:hypothetical protein [Fischerella thermalis]
MRLPVTTVYPRFTRLIISRPGRGGYTVILSPQEVGISPTRTTSCQGTGWNVYIPCSTHFWRTDRTPK